MARRFSKMLKKYERHLLLGLVILLLATFSITGALTRCGGEGDPEQADLGGSFRPGPGDRVELSDSDFRGWYRRYGRVGQMFPTIEYLRNYVPEAKIGQQEATWAHAVVVESARRAGYRVGEAQSAAAVKEAVGLRMPVAFTQATYDQFLRTHLHGMSASEFQSTVGEIVLKDQFLLPFVEAARVSLDPQKAYERWKVERERVDLRYVALPGDGFAEDIKAEETTRAAISRQESVLRNATETARRIQRVTTELERLHKEKGTWPATAQEVAGAVAGAPTGDAWGHPFAYEVRDDKPVYTSPGPDGTAGNADDVTLETHRALDTHANLKEVADAILTWQKAVSDGFAAVEKEVAELRKGAEEARTAGRTDEATTKTTQADDKQKALDARRAEAPGGWPVALAKVREAPVPGASLPSLKRDLKDGWGRDFVFEAGAGGEPPRLSSTGEDGQPGTADDVRAEIAADRVTVPPQGRMAAYVLADLKDAWGRPFRVGLSKPMNREWEVVSAGLDGAFGTEDDLTKGNEGDLRAMFDQGLKEKFKTPIQRRFRALMVHLPLIPDETTKKLWEAYPQHRPADEEPLYTRWNVYRDYYYVAEDPKDPEKGHGAELAKTLAPGKPAWLVPARSIFGDPKPDFAGVDPLRKEFLDEGWREVLLREQFLENLWTDLLKQVRERRTAIAEWEKKKEDDPARGEKPAELTFAELVAQPPLGEHLAGAPTPWATLYETPALLTKEEWEKVPGLTDPAFTTHLGQLTGAGELSVVPVQLNSGLTKVLLENLEFKGERQQTFEEVREQVLDPHFLRARRLYRASERLEDLRRSVEERQKQGSDPVKAWDEAFAEWTAKVKAPAVVETTGWFIGAQPPPSQTPPEGASEEEKAKARRQDFVRQRGYSLVAKARGSTEDTVEAAPGTFGRQVLPDAREAPDGTGNAYLVRVVDRKFPSEEEFGFGNFAQLQAQDTYGDLYGARMSGRRMPSGGEVTKILRRFLEDIPWMQEHFRLETNAPLQPPEPAAP